MNIRKHAGTKCGTHNVVQPTLRYIAVYINACRCRIALCGKYLANMVSLAHFELLNYGFGKLLGKLVSRAKVRSYKLFVLRVDKVSKADAGRISKYFLLGRDIEMEKGNLHFKVVFISTALFLFLVE